MQRETRTIDLNRLAPLRRTSEEEKTQLKRAMQRVGPTAVERLAWAVSFAQTDRHTFNTASVRSSVGSELAVFCWAGQGKLSSSALAVINHQAAGILSMFKQTLDDYVAGQCEIYSNGLTRQITNLKSGSVSSFTGEPLEVAIWMLGDLLVAEGHRLAHCQYAECSRPIFLKPRRNAIYCSKRCGLLEGTRRFRSRPDTISKRQTYRAIGYAREVAARGDLAVAIAGLAHKLKTSKKQAEEMITGGKR